jgi:enterochelin esterase-like enzyme
MQLASRGQSPVAGLVRWTQQGRALLAALCLAWLIVGAVGTYSYLENYYLHRGFPAPVRLPGARSGHLYTIHFYSSALHRRADYLVYLPGGYSTARRYPVLYLLHGVPGQPQAFTTILNAEIRMENLVRRGLMPPMILVFPDGRINGNYFSDSEWANTGSGRFESYVLEVVGQVDRRFAAVNARRARVIAGYSEGAYAAINIALHHPGLFGAAEVWSGYFTQTRSGVFAHATRAELAYNSPLAYARRVGRRLSRRPLRVFLYGGRSDPTAGQIPAMARALRRAGALVRWAIYPGGHDWQLWNNHANQMLVLAGRDVGGTPRAGGQASSRALARPRPTAARPRHPRTAPPNGSLELAGLILALLSAAAINLGFLLQHRGLGGLGGVSRGTATRLRRALRSRSWLGGQALGWAGFSAQILAVSIAPLSLVQAFAAGGLALSVPLAALLFSQRISRTQLASVLIVAASLASLPLGLATRHEHLDTGWLTACAAGAMTLGGALCLARRAGLQAAAAGLFYGAADAGIKAVAVTWSTHGLGSLVSGWAVLAAVATFAGFLAFQNALGGARPVAAISLMSALTALVALLCGVAGFGESLGHQGALVLHLAAIALVLVCLPPLAAAQSELAETSECARSAAAPDRSAPERLGDPGDERADGQQQALKPRTQSRPVVPQHLIEPQIARQRE